MAAAGETPVRLLVVNPVAGGETETVEIVGAVRQATGSDLEIRVTERPGDARAFGEGAATGGASEIWVAGGDGTLREVALGVRGAAVESAPVLFPLPLGTGNDLARSLGVPLDWNDAVEALSQDSQVVELDVVDLELDGQRSVGLNAVIVGNGGRVGDVLDGEGKSLWGPLSYLRSAAEVAMELTPIDVAVQVDEAPPEVRRVVNVVVANGRYAAGGIPIAPGARPNDGILELVIIGDASLAEMLGMLPSLTLERDPDHEAWIHRRASRVRVEAEGAHLLPVSVDGEHFEASVVSMNLSNDLIRVCVPGSRLTVRD